MKKATSSSKTTTVSKSTKQLPVFQTTADLRSAVLVISLLANFFVVCLWIILQITSMYDTSLIAFFIHR